MKKELAERCRVRASIRRNISTRKSVQEGKPDRIADLLDEVANALDPLDAKMRLVILESPFAGQVAENVSYARACIRDALSRGDAPIASHLLYTQPGILDDDQPIERQWGIDAGLVWGRVADATVVYTDLGISRGMKYGIEAAERDGRPIEYRTLPDDVLAGALLLAKKKQGTPFA